MRMLDLRTAVANTLTADSRMVAAGAKVHTHGGFFDLKELLAYGAQGAPAAILAMLMAEGVTQGGQAVAECRFAIVLLCEDKPAPNDRSRQVIDLSDAVLRIVLKTGQRWGLTAHGVGAPTDVRARNLYSRDLDAKGVALWGVEWRQQIDLAESTDLTVPLESINAKWDLAPRDNDAPMIPAVGSVQDAEDEIDLTS